MLTGSRAVCTCTLGDNNQSAVDREVIGAGQTDRLVELMGQPHTGHSSVVLKREFPSHRKPANILQFLKLPFKHFRVM